MDDVAVPLGTKCARCALKGGPVQTATNVELLGCFRLRVDGRTVKLPMQAQRLVAYLAVCDGAVGRHVSAERLWPFSRRERAHANLRTALWRVGKEAPGTIEATTEVIELDDGVVVDYRQLLEPRSDVVGDDCAIDRISDLRAPFLPGWDDDWLLIERERTRQLRMRRLERLSRGFLAANRIADAIDAAYASIDIEPLRESAHLALIQAHAADGNRAEAARQVQRIRCLLREELDIEPSAQFLMSISALGLA